MGLISSIGSVFAPGAANAAADAGRALGNAVAPGSAYWAANNAGAAQAAGYSAQAAALQASPIGTDTSSLEADAAKMAEIQAQYQAMAANGGPIEGAVKDQAQSDLANTTRGKLLAGQRDAADTVGTTAAQERGASGEAANKLSMEQLQAKLKMAFLRATVSHANLQASIAGQGVQNDLSNQAFQQGEDLKQGAFGAYNKQRGIDQDLYNKQFGQAMDVLGAGVAGAGHASADVAGMFGSTGSSAAQLAGNSATTSQAMVGGGTGASAGYSLTAPGAASRMASYPTLDSTANYVNPLGTGDTMPTDPSAWVSYLNLNNTLVS